MTKPHGLLLGLFLVTQPAVVRGGTPDGGVPRSSHAAPAAERRIRFNNRALTDAQSKTLQQVERWVGRIDDGEYWYDTKTGASGKWGGPTLAFLPPGLDLGGPVPASASGGGKGTLTGVFLNGRELHPLDVAGLQQLVGPVWPGRWWVDAQGNYGLDGGPLLGNLVVIAQARRASGSAGTHAWSKHYDGATPRGNMNVASDGRTTCVSTANYSHCTGE